jgi:hypothetical protein
MSRNGEESLSSSLRRLLTDSTNERPPKLSRICGWQSCHGIRATLLTHHGPVLVDQMNWCPACIVWAIHGTRQLVVWKSTAGVSREETLARPTIQMAPDGQDPRASRHVWFSR